MAPGDSTVAALHPMYPETWADVGAGDVLYLYEGVRLCGHALVLAREDLSDSPRPLDTTEAVRWAAHVHLGTAPEDWRGMDNGIAVDGSLMLPRSRSAATLVPRYLTYEDQQAIGVAQPWAAGLFVSGRCVQAAYGTGPDPLLAVVAGEQRWLVEEEASGASPGDTYLEKARNRVGQIRTAAAPPAGARRLGLPHPWVNLDTQDRDAVRSRVMLQAELTNEIKPGHQLFGIDLEVVARCNGHCDDVIVRTPNAWWRVHPTYSKQERPPWPMADRYDTALSLVAALTSGEHEVSDFLE